MSGSRHHLGILSASFVPPLLLLACGSPAPVAPPPAPVATSATAEPSAPPPPVAEVPPTPPAAPSPFQKVGAVDAEAAVFARGPGSAYLAVGVDVVAVAEGDAVTLRPNLHQAESFPIRPFSQLTTVRKGTGESVWAGWIFPEGRVGATLVERFDGKKWGKGTRSRNGYTINQIFDLGPNRLVAIQEPQMFPDDTPRVLAVEGGQAGLPQVSRAATKAPPDVPAAANLLFMPTAILPTKNGGSHLLGHPFPRTEGQIVRPMYETFDAKGKSKGHGELDLGVTDKSLEVSFVATPLPEGPMVLVVSEGTGQAGVVSLRLARPGAEKPELVRIEGVTGTPAAMASDAQGNVYLITSGATTSLFRIPPDGKAQPVVLPVDLRGASTGAPTVMAKGPDDVWLFVPAGGKLDVYRTKANAPKIEVALPNPQEAFWAKRAQADEAREAKAEQRRLVFAKVFTSKCETPFVLLYTLAKTAPKDYDFPATRDALKGHTELAKASFVEFSRGGQRFFGAIVPTGDLGKKLVDAVKGKVPGSTPQLVCDAPAPDRTLAIDLATGKMKP